LFISLRTLSSLLHTRYSLPFKLYHGFILYRIDFEEITSSTRQFRRLVRCFGLGSCLLTLLISSIVRKRCNGTSRTPSLSSSVVSLKTIRTVSQIGNVYLHSAHPPPPSPDWPAKNYISFRDQKEINRCNETCSGPTKLIIWDCWPWSDFVSGNCI